MRLLFDIETDGFLESVTTLHSLCIKDIDSGRVWSCCDHAYETTAHNTTVASIAHGLNMLRSATLLVGHNIISYDLPVLQKLYPAFKWTAEITDTLIEARLNWPRDALRPKDFALQKQQKLPGNLIGNHSLEAFGYRLGVLKGDYSAWCKEQGIDPWSAWRPEMQSYCELDVAVTELLYNRCVQANYSRAASAIEHRVQFIVAQMERNGFPFKEAEAALLYAKVCEERDALGLELRTLFEPWYAPASNDKGDDGGEKKARAATPKKDRLVGAAVETRVVNGRKRKVKVGGVQYTAGAPYTPIELREFNPNSRAHIADRLKKKCGWEPTDFTEDGNAIVDEKVLASLPYPEARPLSRFLLLQKRAGQISEGNEGWLKVSRSGHIYGRVNILGAVTRRASHSKPNIAQVPKVGSYFGAECRALFWAGEGYDQIGVDLAGIELRMLAHYMARWDGGAYARAVCEGTQEEGTDVHSLNARALGLDPQGLYVVGGKQQKGRDIAKTFIYAFLYGAGAAKLARILGRSESEGASIKARFLKGLPALKALIDAVQAAVKAKGHLIGLDGGRIPVRSAHSALNSLLQSAGAIVAKWWIAEVFDALSREGWVDGIDFLLRAFVHDELQFSVRPEIADAFGKVCVAAIESCGVKLNLRLPITGEFKRGKSWLDCH